MTITLIPGSEGEAAEMIREAGAERIPLAICGGGTRAGFGTPVKTEATLHSSGLCGIVAYNPAEMVMTAWAGTPLAEVEAALAEKGQMLAFEPMDHRGAMGTRGEPTVGGVFAANVSGPRRIVAGAARDSLLGVRFVNGNGEVIKAGGRVMKNVTGLDLAKLLAGSYGTLGFLTEVTFRLLPRPQATETVVLSGLDDAHATAAMATAMAMPVEVSGAAHLPQTVKGRFLNGALPEGEATAFRLEGLVRSVGVRAEKLQAALSSFGPVTRLGAEESVDLWREIRDVAPYPHDGRVLWRVSVAPTAGHQLVAAMRLQAGIDAFYDWQGGLIWMRMEADPEATMLRQAIALIGGGHATLIRAPDHVRATIAGFEPEAAPVAALSQRLREKFDPLSILNPGRME